MIQATTPTFVFTLPEGVDLSAAAHVYFTISQSGVIVTKDEMEISGNVVTVSLTQEDTVNFNFGIDAKVQLNWTYSDGSRMATKVQTVPVFENLHKDVLE